MHLSRLDWFDQFDPHFGRLKPTLFLIDEWALDWNGCIDLQYVRILIYQSTKTLESRQLHFLGMLVNVNYHCAYGHTIHTYLQRNNPRKATGHRIFSLPQVLLEEYNKGPGLVCSVALLGSEIAKREKLMSLGFMNLEHMTWLQRSHLWLTPISGSDPKMTALNKQEVAKCFWRESNNYLGPFGIFLREIYFACGYGS